MRRKLYVLLCISAAAGTVTACGNTFKADDSTVYITKKGNVIGASIEDFSEDYYDEEELKNYITESVEDYVESNGDGSVELSSFEVETSDGRETAKLYLDYATYIDYAQFNGVTLYAGTVSDAQKEGFEFNQKFQKAEDGSVSGSVEAGEILENEDEALKAVIIGEETIVKIDGEICYISEENAELNDSGTVKVHYNMEDPEAEPAYIIYK